MDVTDLTRLLLIRHGDCTQTATEPDPGLSELGRMQCELLRDRLMATGEADRASARRISAPARGRVRRDTQRRAKGSGGRHGYP